MNNISNAWNRDKLRQGIGAALLWGLLMLPSAASGLEILGVNRDGLLTWHSEYDAGTLRVQRTEGLAGAVWSTVHEEPAVAGIRSIVIDMDAPSAFYRLAVDAGGLGLVLHMDFTDDFSGGVIRDVSGSGNDGLRYKADRWPSVTTGPDGSPAAEFHEYVDGFGLGRTGDYVVIPKSDPLTGLEEMTIAVWGWYYLASGGSYLSNNSSTFVDTHWRTYAGSWKLGRNYTNSTRFAVAEPGNSTLNALTFPDATRSGDTGGWNHYAVTFRQGVFKGYFNGQKFAEVSVPSVPELIIGGKGHYMALGCWHHNGTPEWDDSPDVFPNNGWLNGAIDDLRIYSSALSDEEILALSALPEDGD